MREQLSVNFDSQEIYNELRRYNSNTKNQTISLQRFKKEHIVHILQKYKGVVLKDYKERIREDIEYEYETRIFNKYWNLILWTVFSTLTNLIFIIILFGKQF